MTEEVEGLGEKKKEEFNSIFNEIRKRINEEKELRLSRPIRLNLTHLENMISPIGREFSDIIHEEEPVERKFANESIQDLLLKVQQESNDALEDNLEMRGDIRELETELEILQKENKELRALADEGGDLTEIQKQVEQFSLMVLSKGEADPSQNYDLLRILFGPRALKKLLISSRKVKRGSLS